MSIRPNARALAFIVDSLRAKLPPQFMKLREVRTMLALDEITVFDDDEILAALLYLEARGEVSRAPTHGGWRSRIPTGRGTPQRPPASLFQTYNKDGELDG